MSISLLALTAALISCLKVQIDSFKVEARLLIPFSWTLIVTSEFSAAKELKNANSIDFIRYSNSVSTYTIFSRSSIKSLVYSVPCGAEPKSANFPVLFLVLEF